MAGHGFALGAVEGDVLAANQIYDAAKTVLAAYWKLEQQGVGSKPGTYFIHHVLGVGAGAIQFVYEGDAWRLVAVGLAPHLFGLGLNAGHTAKDADGAIEDAKAPLYLGGEIDVAGGVDEVYPAVKPGESGDGGTDGDAPFLLVLHEVHNGGAIMDFAHAVLLA
jgi:hypothetical protein